MSAEVTAKDLAENLDRLIAAMASTAPKKAVREATVKAVSDVVRFHERRAATQRKRQERYTDRLRPEEES